MFPDRILTFGPLAYEVRGVSIVIEQFVWDSVQLHHDADTLGGPELDRWFDYWFDTDDTRLNPTSDIAGIVHSLFIKAGELDVDFGTAATEAFWDILDLLAAAGATNIRVTSDRRPE